MPFVRKIRLAHLEGCERELKHLLDLTPLELQLYIAQKKALHNIENRLAQDFWGKPESPGQLKSIRSYFNNV